MHYRLLYYILQKAEQFIVNYNGVQGYGRLILEANGYAISFETSSGDSLVGKVIICSSDEPGIEQLAISLGEITNHRISAKRENTRYTYLVKWIRYCDSRHILLQEWDITSVKLLYLQALHNIFLVPQYNSLQNVDCGDNLILKAGPLQITDQSSGLNCYKACFSFERTDHSVITYEEIRKIINRLDAIISALGYRPIDYQEIIVSSRAEGNSDLEEAIHTNHLVLPTIPKYGATDFGPYQDLKPTEVRLRKILDHFLEKNLTPILYWRVCCIFGAKDDLFTENIFNQQFICLDSLVSNMLVHNNDKISANKDIENLVNYLKAQNPTTEQVSKKMFKYLKSSSFRAAYSNRGDLSSKTCKLFYGDKKPGQLSELEQRFLKAVNLLRNDFAHGRMLEWPSILRENEYEAFTEWLYSNIHKAILEFINQGGGTNR